MYSMIMKVERGTLRAECLKAHDCTYPLHFTSVKYSMGRSCNKKIPI